MRFNIKNLIKFKIIDRTSKLNKIFSTFEKQYNNFLIYDDPPEYDLILTIGKYRPNLDGCYNCGNGKFYFKEDYICVPCETYKGARWGFQINGLNEKETKIDIECNELGRIFIQGYIIDFMIHLKLLKKGYPIIHASSVKKENHGYLFASRGGGGKTTISLGMAFLGFEFMSDNFTIIHEGNIIAFSTPLNLFTYNISSEIIKKMTVSEQRLFKLKEVAFKLTNGYAKFFTKIDPVRIFNQIGDEAMLDCGFIIIPKKGDNNISISKIDFLEFVQRNLFNQKMEFPQFDRLNAEYSYYYPDSEFSRHWIEYKKKLMVNLNNRIPYYRIDAPVGVNKLLIEKIVRFIEKDRLDNYDINNR